MAAHARLARELAAHAGNAHFGGPQPLDAVLQAIGLHDAGWTDQDRHPTLNAAGEPVDAFEMPLETSLAIWSLSAQRAQAAGPYAGLLVSLHGLALSALATVRTPAQKFALIKFQHRQVEAQESLRRELSMRTDLPLRQGLADPGRSEDEDRLLLNFRLLQLADQLSLNLCFDEARFASIKPVLAQSDKETTALTFSRQQTDRFSLDPWPFDQDELTFQVPAKCVGTEKYRNDEELRQALDRAAERTIQVSLTR